MVKTKAQGCGEVVEIRGSGVGVYASRDKQLIGHHLA